jgi:hypothetical protein
VPSVAFPFVTIVPGREAYGLRNVVNQNSRLSVPIIHWSKGNEALLASLYNERDATPNARTVSQTSYFTVRLMSLRCIFFVTNAAADKRVE